MSSRTIDFPLTSNGFTLDAGPERLGWLEPTDPGLPLQALRERYQANGVLWLKGILPRQKVLDFRARFFSAYAGSGLLREGSDPRDGIYSGEVEERGLVNKILMTQARSAAYEAFCLMDEIWSFYEKFLEGAPYLHKRKIIRYTRPLDKNCTGAHYDLVYLRGGTERLCTSWIPIGDTPVEMGGLVYLEGSDDWGRQSEAETRTRTAALPAEDRISAYNQYMDQSGWLDRDLAALANRLNTRWLAADYEAGDMVVHSPYMIHASTMNLNPDGRMRLSTDIRYQRVQDEIDARWQNHWSLDDML